MPETKTLQSFLSARYLREWAGAKLYDRGNDYYAQGCVRLLEHGPELAVAEVKGSHPYRVEWKLAGPTAMADCTCPAMSDYSFCKHAVALGLMLSDAPPPIQKSNEHKRSPEADHFAEQSQYHRMGQGWLDRDWP